MTSLFLRHWAELVAESAPMGPDGLPYVRQAFEDTLAVVHAGWQEPVTRRVAALYPQADGLSPESAADGLPPEAAALLLGTAAHALDYDDVHMASSTHPSAVLVPALLAARAAAPDRADRLVTAFGVGLATNVALGTVLGFPHYEKGWHATSTIGPLAAAGALAYYFELPSHSAAHSLALAAAQAGGLQRNFGSMAKPVHAGLAAAAAVRAALLARIGVTADNDIFAAKGYFDLYGGRGLAADPDTVGFDIGRGGICVKLYPCCYLAHRPIAAALEARVALQERGIAAGDLAEVEIAGPQGAFTALRVQTPRVGSEGKFCGPYAVTCALLDGAVTLAHFEDEALRRADVQALLPRIRLTESGGEGSLHGGEVVLTARSGSGEVLAETRVAPFPGSPEDPPTPAQREAKVRDCLAHDARRGGTPPAYEAFRDGLEALFLPSTRHSVSTAGQRAAGD